MITIMGGRDSVGLPKLEIAAYMTIPGPGPEAHRVAVKRGVNTTGAGIGDQRSLVTPNYGALIGLGERWRAQPIEKQEIAHVRRLTQLFAVSCRYCCVLGGLS